jgi:hypothetical protein
LALKVCLEKMGGMASQESVASAESLAGQAQQGGKASRVHQEDQAQPVLQVVCITPTNQEQLNNAAGCPAALLYRITRNGRI